MTDAAEYPNIKYVVRPVHPGLYTERRETKNAPQSRLRSLQVARQRCPRHLRTSATLTRQAEQTANTITKPRTASSCTGDSATSCRESPVSLNGA
jgi:hypothetical protein